MTPQQSALDVIRGEHRALGAVIDALRHVANEIALGQLATDFRLLWSIIYYLEEFPEALHHPKEDQVLFPRIRRRIGDIDATLDDLGRQHTSGRPYLNALQTLLGRMEAGIPDATRDFSDKVENYAAFQLKHMALEESVVLPKAVEVLTAQDWEEVAASFCENRDPLQDRSAATSGSEWFRQFYSRIVARVPEPWGVGARR